MTSPAPIVILRAPIAPAELARLVRQPFGDMVKFVVDVERHIVALGGELHADAEALLLEDGSAQEALWCGNYYPGRGECECIEYHSLINIRPSQGNRGVLVQDPQCRQAIRALVFERVGRGEVLP